MIICMLWNDHCIIPKMGYHTNFGCLIFNGKACYLHITIIWIHLLVKKIYFTFEQCLSSYFEVKFQIIGLEFLTKIHGWNFQRFGCPNDALLSEPRAVKHWRLFISSRLLSFSVFVPALHFRWRQSHDSTVDDQHGVPAAQPADPDYHHDNGPGDALCPSPGDVVRGHGDEPAILRGIVHVRREHRGSAANRNTGGRNEELYSFLLYS